MSKHLRVGYFAQHQVEVLDGQSTPLQLLQLNNPAKSEQELRDYLGGFDFRDDRAETKVINFSGGEKVRLALAMIAWQKPNLLLLDEPSSGLDRDETDQLSATLRAVQEEQGFAMLLVEHDVELVREFNQRSDVLDSGMMIAQGDTRTAMEDAAVRAA